MAGDRVWVSDPDAGEVICLGLADGKERFRSSLGNRIDGPPAIVQGLVVAGGHDGWLYAWSTADGSLVRRTRLAAGERRIAIQGRIESPWPVVGPVVVDGLRAYAMVGRHQRMAERVHTTAVNLSDGVPVWRKVEHAFAGMLAIDGGAVVSCLGIGATGWWGEQMHGVNRDPASGATAKASPGLSTRLARNHLLHRSQPGPAGSGPFVCADDGSNLAWFDYAGREVRLSPRAGFAPKMKFSGSVETINAADLNRNATWRLTVPDGEIAVAVAIAGDAVVCASNRPAPADKGGLAAGHLWVLNLADGKERQRLDLPHPIAHQGIAIHDGAIVLSGRNGQVTAYGAR